MKASAKEQYDKMVQYYSQNQAQFDANMRTMQSSIDTVQREALEFRVRMNDEITKRDRIIMQLGGRVDGSQGKPTEFFEIGNGTEEFQSCGKKPTDSGSSRTQPACT